jgi:hypothetical protein
MKKYLIPLLILGVVVAAALTCPDKSAHKHAVNGVIKEVVQEKVSEYVGKDVGSVVTRVVATATDWIIDQGLTVNNYFLFSVGNFKTDDGAKTVSVGAFGHIFTFGKEDVKEALKDYSGDSLKEFVVTFVKEHIWQLL